jgi:hypothetical protein
MLVAEGALWHPFRCDRLGRLAVPTETRYYLVTGVSLEALRVLIAEGKANIAREQIGILLNGPSFPESEITVVPERRIILPQEVQN